MINKSKVIYEDESDGSWSSFSSYAEDGLVSKAFQVSVLKGSSLPSEQIQYLIDHTLIDKSKI